MAVSEVLAALADETRRKVLQKLKEGRINSDDLANPLLSAFIALQFLPEQGYALYFSFNKGDSSK